MFTPIKVKVDSKRDRGIVVKTGGAKVKLTWPAIAAICRNKRQIMDSVTMADCVCLYRAGYEVTLPKYVFVRLLDEMVKVARDEVYLSLADSMFSAWLQLEVGLYRARKTCDGWLSSHPLRSVPVKALKITAEDSGFLPNIKVWIEE